MDLTTITGHETAGANAVNSQGTSVSAPGTANTKGTWVELIASTAQAASWLSVLIGNPGNSGRYLLDVGVGAGGSEAVLLPDLHYDYSLGAHKAYVEYRFPVAVAAGSRLAARCQSSQATSAGLKVVAILGQGPNAGLAGAGGVHAYGVSAADSGLTSVDPGATANAEGAWVELTASATAAIRWLNVGIGHDAAALSADTHWLLDVGTGAAASEAVLLGNLPVYGSNTTEIHAPSALWFPVDVAAGTRIAARAQCSSNATPNRLLDVAVYGVDAPAPSGGGGGARAFASWG